MSLVHAFTGLSAYLSVCVCLSLCYLFISFYYRFVFDSNKWNGISLTALLKLQVDTISSHVLKYICPS